MLSLSTYLLHCPQMNTPDQNKTRPTGEAGRSWVEMPDGGYLRALNGVVDPPKILWDRALPHAPVVDIRRLEDGRDWFVHADGTLTTTCRLWRDDLGREDVTTLTQHPRTVDGVPETTGELVSPRSEPAASPRRSRR